MGAPVRSCAIVITAAAVLSACAASRQSWSVAVPQPNLRRIERLDSISDYRTAAGTVARVFEKDLGFPTFPVTFQFFPDREAFEQALVDVGYDAALARSTASTMTAVGGHRGVLLNEASLGTLPWPGRIALLAHEMGHSLQYELGGGRRGTSDQWLREGFAEWVSIRVLERLEAASMADVRRERLRELRAARRSDAPALSQLVTFPQWVEASRRPGATTYALSYLAADFLLERHGVPAVVDYFKRFAAREDRVGNFRAAFGEDLQAFEGALVERVWAGRRSP